MNSTAVRLHMHIFCLNDTHTTTSGTEGILLARKSCSCKMVSYNVDFSCRQGFFSALHVSYSGGGGKEAHSLPLQKILYPRFFTK